MDRRPAWLLDELASAGREHADGEHAAQYDAKEDAGALDEIAQLARWGFDERSVVVDMGAGTGQFTVAVAPRCAHVVAVDISSVMLDILRRKVAAAGLTNVEVVEAGFLTYQHRGPPVDVVYSRYALHHLPDFWKALALARIRTMLRPGGILRISDVIYGFDPLDAETRLDAWCRTIDDDAADGGWRRADIEEHIRDEHSTYTWLIEPMIERSGFHIDEVAASPDGIFCGYIATAT